MVSADRIPGRDEILGWLREVKDPELPVVDVVGLGIVRDVEITDGSVTVVITPTFTGCPALRAIETDVVACLESHGLEHVAVRTDLAPAWTTDAIETATKRRLAETGIAPPLPVARAEEPSACPRCGSPGELRSAFGSTPCKALWWCPTCGEPFEGMKAL